MKIAFDHQIFSSQQYGGVSRYFVELAKNIPKASKGGAEVKIIAPLYKNEYLRSNRKQLDFRGLYIPHIPRVRRFVRYANSLLMPQYLRHLMPDIIHQTYYSANTHSSIGTKKVITVYDMIHELFSEQFSLNGRDQEVKKIAISRADHVICISENTRKDLIKILDIDPEKTSVVHLGVSLSVKDNKISDSTFKPYLLYVGSRGGYKNFNRFIEAYASSSKLKDSFAVVAYGGGLFRPSELSLFESFKLRKERITQVSGSDELLAHYYRNAALFVYPSLYEGFGIPPLEAMGYGCPVACSNTSSIPEVVGNAPIFFDPYSTDSITDSLEKALFDSELRELVIAKGLQRIRAFSWEKCARETFQVYEQLL